MLLHQFWRDMGDYVDACEWHAHYGQYGSTGMVLNTQVGSDDQVSILRTHSFTNVMVILHVGMWV
jgi:hypothetical protein